MDSVDMWRVYGFDNPLDYAAFVAKFSKRYLVCKDVRTVIDEFKADDIYQRKFLDRDTYMIALGAVMGFIHATEKWRGPIKAGGVVRG